MSANGTRGHVELDQNVGQCVGVVWQSTGADHDHDILETELQLCSPLTV